MRGQVLGAAPKTCLHVRQLPDILPAMTSMNAVDKKAYEIAYALCRIAEKTGEPLGGILSNKGLQLLAAVVENDTPVARRLILALGYFIKLGAGLDRVSQGNVDLLIS